MPQLIGDPSIKSVRVFIYKAVCTNDHTKIVIAQTSPTLNRKLRSAEPESIS